MEPEIAKRLQEERFNKVHGVWPDLDITKPKTISKNKKKPGRSI